MGLPILGNLLSIKPILHFNDEGVIEVFEKVRTEKKAMKRLVEIVEADIADGHYQVFVIHANVPEKAEALRHTASLKKEWKVIFLLLPLAGVIGTHLGDHSVS